MGLCIDYFETVNKIEADLEMHDKLVVATALYFDAGLITKDELIKAAGICSIVW